jgi:hypothetical protein
MMSLPAYWRIPLIGLTGFLLMQANDNLSAEPSNTAPSGVVGWIDVEPRREGDRLTLALTGWALATSPISGNYVLTVRKHGRGGSSDTSQSGRFTAAPDTPSRLSSTAFNIAPADRFEIDLRISAEGQEIFRVSMKPAGLPSP